MAPPARPRSPRPGTTCSRPNQRGYGHSTAPRDVDAYGIEHLTGDLVALLDHYGKEQAVFVGHDWGALIVWDMAKLHPERMRAVVGVQRAVRAVAGAADALMRSTYGDRFFYILYFQQVGPPEAELDADPRTHDGEGAVRRVGAAAWSAARSPAELPPMEGTGFLTMMPRSTGAAVHRARGPVADRGRTSTVYADEFAPLRVLRTDQLLPQPRRQLRARQ